jgi:O-antigen/teichoic acid export membrane protein
MAELLTVASMVWALRLVESRWGVEGLGEYLNMRRAIPLLQLPCLCGIGLGLCRLVAMSGGERGGEERWRLLGSALAIVAVALSLFMAGVWAAAEPLSRLLLGTAVDPLAMLAVSFCLPGLVLHGVIHGWLSGHMRTPLACLLQWANLGLLPLATIFLAPPGVAAYFAWLGVGWGVFSALVLATILVTDRAGRRNLWPDRKSIVRLLTYGLPRVPTEFLWGAYTALPTLLLIYVAQDPRQGLAEVAYLGTAISAVAMLGSGFAPLGQITLPMTSAELHRGDLTGIRRRLVRLTGVTLGLAIALTMVGWLLTPLLLGGYFGPRMLPASPVVRLVLLGGVPYCMYVVLRSFLDALSPFPINGKNIALAMLFLATIGLALGSVNLIPVAFCGSLFVLGIASLADGWRLTAAGRVQAASPRRGP